MIASAAVMLGTITTVLLLLIGLSNQEQVYAQNQTQATNFTQLFSTEKEFCLAPQSVTGAGCLSYINVLYEDPKLLVLSSNYIDVIWKGVARALEEGYQIDSMTSYDVSNPLSTSGDTTVNLLVAMSK